MGAAGQYALVARHAAPTRQREPGRSEKELYPLQPPGAASPAPLARTCSASVYVERSASTAPFFWSIAGCSRVRFSASPPPLRSAGVDHDRHAASGTRGGLPSAIYSAPSQVGLKFRPWVGVPLLPITDRDCP